ncbi:hypothetical protein MTP03_17060 [Tsukamurella sp. PLM1]|nr:hypothetical protein MTP03_17060 [Tsukamurella sp. PLM1]
MADLLPHQRARVLTRIADAIEDNAPRLAALQTANTGKTLTETSALVASAAGTFRYFAAALETSDADLTTPRGEYLTMSLWEPIGVVGAITPWNSPIASDAQKIAPALAAGNAVVLKPAAWTPWSRWPSRASSTRAACPRACCRSSRVGAPWSATRSCAIRASAR